jgi:hypothetical protein
MRKVRALNTADAREFAGDEPAASAVRFDGLHAVVPPQVRFREVSIHRPVAEA